MTNVVVPIGGRHQSASSLLAELYADTTIEKIVVSFIDKDGECYTQQFGMTVAEMAYAALVIQNRIQRKE